MLEVEEEDKTRRDLRSLQDEADETHHLTSPARDREVDPTNSLDSVSLYRCGLGSIGHRDSITSQYKITRPKVADRLPDSSMPNAKEVMNDIKHLNDIRQQQRQTNLTSSDEQDQQPKIDESIQRFVSFAIMASMFAPPDPRELQSDPDKQPRLKYGLSDGQ